ncbi:hypothetical protein ACTFQF_05165 [Aliivibrio fischeri]|uniref:hypothetical protein n=1 Tax=Aliivibrio fischeri TaxID=668 RepID=UPI0007C4961C|nr:hypothetical protein [Aliivibrio fischeri]MBP3140621.1 hypothetical protein [Aliivibrio fischeri]MBP3156073.1 hypothetical protein [Aliivibrio fischeri]MCE7574397.1 hypothetical protein [Aliivibrio fischeri]
MKKTLIVALALFIAAPVTTAAPLEIYKEYRGNASVLRATARDNNVVIKNIVLNQGDCQNGKVRLTTVEKLRYPNGRQIALPYTMKMGEKRMFSPSEICNIIEATVRTNSGDWTWTFN